MSVKKNLAPPAENEGQGPNGNQVARKRSTRGFNRCFSFVEISLEPGTSLKDMDSNKLKDEIKRWAKAVAAYARQVSGRLGSSLSRRSNDKSGSMSRSGRAS